jgi:serine/threonine protein phosphatase PrpC
MTHDIKLQAANRYMSQMGNDYVSTALFSSTTDGRLFVITEGIRALGTRADLTSSIPVRIIPDELKDLQSDTAKGLSDEHICERIKSAFEKANLAVYNEKLSRSDQMRDFSGSSATCLFILGRTAFIGQVGIGRVYLLRNNTLQQLTKDHSAYANMEPDEEIFWLNKFAWSQHLIRALGHQPSIATDIFVQSLEVGDRLLLCSSGIWLFIPETQLSQFLNPANEPEVVAQNIVEALPEGVHFDFSFVVIKVVGV